MLPTLEYEDLEMDRVDRLLAEHGEIRVSLNTSHAAPLTSLIDVIRATGDWKRLPLLSRLSPGAKALVLTARITFLHSRLLSLLNVIVLHAPAQLWHTRPDGSVLFHFVRPPGKV